MEYAAMVAVDGRAVLEHAPEPTRERLMEQLKAGALRDEVCADGVVRLDLRNFSALTQAHGTFVESAPFAFGGRRFVAKVYPNGNSAQYVGCVACYIRPHEPSPVPVALSLNFKTFTVGPNPRQINECGSIDQIGTAASGYAFGNELIVRRDRLIEAIGASDCAEVRIHIRLYGPRENLAEKAVKTAQTQLLGDIARLWRSGDGADCVLSAQGRLFRAHKVLLCARSSVMRAMLCGNFREAAQASSKEAPIELEDVAPAVLEKLLEFMYTGSAAQPESAATAIEWWEALLAGADRFALKDLFEICQTRLAELITPGNVAAIFALTTKFVDAVLLKEAAVLFVKTHPIPQEEVQKFDVNTLREIVLRNASVMVAAAAAAAPALAEGGEEEGEEEESEEQPTKKKRQQRSKSKKRQ